MDVPTWQPELSQRDQARSTLIAADSPTAEQVSLAAVWEELVSGVSKVADAFCTESRCYALLAKTTGRPPLRLTERRVACLERYLLGEQPKVVADELRLSRSTITTDLGECLDAMGIRRQTSRVPVFFAMAVRASRGNLQVPNGRLSRVAYFGSEHSLVSVGRPDLALSNQLSPAECSVARMLLEGRSHAEIAELRQTSVRTIANQLAATFHKLGVSGRSQLRCYVLSTSPAVNYAS